MGSAEAVERTMDAKGPTIPELSGQRGGGARLLSKKTRKFKKRSSMTELKAADAVKG